MKNTIDKEDENIGGVGDTVRFFCLYVVEFRRNLS